MPRNGSRVVPHQRLSGANNHYTNNTYNTNQSHQDTFFVPNDVSLPRILPTDYTPDVYDQLFSPPAIPLLASTGQNTGFPYSQLSMIPQLDIFDVPDAFGGFPFNGSVPASSSPLSTANGYTARVNEGPQGSPVPVSWPPLSYISPSTVVVSPDNEKSPPYQCLECPNLPKFSSQKDLERHYITSKAHWSENTRFYRCCCAAYDRPRKDHHLRHVQFCKAVPHSPYTCTCGRQCWAQDDHVEHVTNCRRGRIG